MTLRTTQYLKPRGDRGVEHQTRILGRLQMTQRQKAERAPVTLAGAYSYTPGHLTRADRRD